MRRAMRTVARAMGEEVARGGERQWWRGVYAMGAMGAAGDEADGGGSDDNDDDDRREARDDGE